MNHLWTYNDVSWFSSSELSVFKLRWRRIPSVMIFPKIMKNSSPYHCHITVISLSYHPTDIRSTPNHRRWPPRTHYGTRFHLKNYPEPWFPQWFRINTHKQYPPCLDSTPFCWATSVKTRSWGHDSSTHFVASRMAVPEAVLQGYDDEMNSICDIITNGWKKSTLIK